MVKEIPEKIEIKLWKLGDAGGYDLIVRDNGISKSLEIKLTLSLGQPFICAHREAELLATTLNCDLILNDKIIRHSIKRGE